MSAIESPSRVFRRSIGSERIVLNLPLPLHLAYKEVWRNKGRFFLIAVVVALITLLVLFTAGLSEGLGLGNREYIANLDADLLVYSDKSELLIPGSRISEARVRDLRQIDGVQSVGAIAWSNVAIILPNGRDPVKVALGGVLAGQPGEPHVVDGHGLDFKRGMEAVIDRSTAVRTGLKAGDKLVVRSLVASKEKLYELTVAGIAGSNQYSLQPTVFVPHLTYEKIRPRASDLPSAEGMTPPVSFNVAMIQLNNPADRVAMAARIERVIADSRSILRENDGVLVVEKQKAWESTPGYSAQQSTLGLQRAFTLLIGLLVVGSFFRIQAAQKIAQVGVLKAIGTASWKIGGAALIQIFFVNAFGVLLGAGLTFLLTLGIPPVVPIRFDGNDVVTTIVLLLVIGPLGGVVAVRALLQAEPLKALGLAS
ncbi:MAG: ABC transporter permease [Chloroflexi bacterium]|nr:ABC transporter permease [Chloroflexota bacterium]